jgi:hypothetical protein
MLSISSTFSITAPAELVTSALSETAFALAARSIDELYDEPPGKAVAPEPASAYETLAPYPEAAP